MQKIWVCGARGQIGQAVNDVVDKLEFEMLDTDVDDLDVTDTGTDSGSDESAEKRDRYIHPVYYT